MYLYAGVILSVYVYMHASVCVSLYVSFVIVHVCVRERECKLDCCEGSVSLVYVSVCACTCGCAHIFTDLKC